MAVSASEALEGKDGLMLLEKNRLKTFSKQWPIRKGLCIPENMAKAGFYQCYYSKGSDCVRCFCCFKELDNWDTDDDPFVEHLKHQPSCSFAKLGLGESQLTIAQFLQIIEDREVNRLVKLKQKFIKSEPSILTSGDFF